MSIHSVEISGEGFTVNMKLEKKIKFVKFIDVCLGVDVFR
jgi:hypothetical protein